MTLVTYPPEKKSKKVGELFEDRNTNVVTLHHQPEALLTPPAAQPDTRTGKPNTGAYKPNTGAYKPNTDAYKPNTDAYKAINGESAESWYAASC
jgi:hypothetical protein